MDSRIVCTPKRLPPDLWERAADTATTINPVNRAPVHRLIRIIPGFSPTKAALAVLTTKYWGAKGVKLTVGFLDSPAADLRKRILAHMNAWTTTANVQFVVSNTDPQVRIARVPNDGYWSYLGTDILHIKPDEQTMNLDSFTMQVPESEYKRVVRHETGHTLGFPHEHMRSDLVAEIDEAKAIAYFQRTQGWSADEVRAQVLTPLEKGSLLGTATADARSIMCYQIPGEITKSGEPIVGGTDIDKWDRQFVALIYPKPKAKPKPKSKANAKAKGVRKPSRKGRPLAKSTAGGRKRRGMKARH
jgi:Astacin (Peptidase family M12A)